MDVLCLGHQFLSELLDALEPAAWALKDRLGDEHVCIAHELLVLAHLGVKKVREDVTCDHFVLLTREGCDGSLGFCAKFPICLLRVQAKTASFFVSISTS